MNAGKILAAAALTLAAGFSGALMLSMIVAYPQLLWLIVPVLAAGGVLIRRYIILQNRRLDDAVTERAWREHHQTQQGNPTGTFGRYPPA